MGYVQVAVYWTWRLLIVGEVIVVSSALANHHRATLQKTARQITGLILALERAMTAQAEAIAFLSQIRTELTDSILDDDVLVTGLIDLPLLRGNGRLSVGEAERIVHHLTDMIEHSGRPTGKAGN